MASKRGMSIKEIRQKMREDESKNRQLIRYADICSKQMQYVNPLGITDMVNVEAATYPSWFTHLNSHGMIYSQYNVQNYGNVGSKIVINDHRKRCIPIKKHCHAVPKTRQSEYHNKESQVKADVKSDTGSFPEDNLFKSTCHPFTPSTVQLVESKNSNDNVLSLLYRANLSNRASSSCNTSMRLCPLRGNNSLQNSTPSSPITLSTTMLKNIDCIKVPAKVNEESNRSNSCKASDPTTKCNLPRKLAAHNLASLCAAEDEDDSAAMTIARSDSSLLDLERNSDSDFDVSEIQILEEMDQGKAVVSPLIKKAETALADLQKSDALFGTMDDFGNLMNQANYLL